MKRVGYLAGPMITMTLSQYFLQIILMMMVGLLGKLALSSTAIAISGFSLIVILFLSHLIAFFLSFKTYNCIEPKLSKELKLFKRRDEDELKHKMA